MFFGRNGGFMTDVKYKKISPEGDVPGRVIEGREGSATGRVIGGREEGREEGRLFGGCADEGG
jgi:hypothetical protein